ncbi:MAG TPA: DUF1080 domain-containing protein [Puia sp.]|nr:DUF1080 domain-containing protein [Puia sp.]
MKRLFYLPILFFLLGNGAVRAQTKTSDGWQALFDGKSFNGWRKVAKDSLPDAGWSTDHGELTFDPAKGHGTDIITTTSFGNFELSLDFKISEGGNSGVKYSLLPNTSLGCEYQIIDDSRHPDAKLGINGNRKTGALYDILPASVDKPDKGPGEWNAARIIVKGRHVEHWLNGVKILEYEKGSDAFRQAIAASKFKTTPGFSDPESSPVLLQAHGDKVQFRNIKIRELQP